MSLLTIVQNASDRCGVAKPSSVISNTDGTAVQMLNLVNQEGLALMRRYDWQVLRTEGSFTTLAAETQATISSSWAALDRFVQDTMFDRTSKRKIYGPLGPVEWQEYKSGSFTGIASYFTVRGGLILFTPNPTAGNSVYFEYISKNWCETSGGTDKSSFTIDTDVGILSEELLTLGVVWRFLKAKGMPSWADAYADYELQATTLAGQDGVKPILSMNPRRGLSPALRDGFVSEGDWPL